MRLALVLNREVQESKRNLLIYSLTIFLVLLFQEMLAAFLTRMARGDIGDSAYLANFPGFLFLGGFIVTSVFFSDDMFSRIGQHNWLTLPASPLEKFLAKALLTSVAYPLALVALFTLSSVVIELLALLVFGSPFSMFNPFTIPIGQMILHYLATQSIFLLGATYFRKAHFIKTVLALGLLGVLMGIVATIFVRILFAPYISGMFGFNFTFDDRILYQYEGLLTVAEWIDRIVYWIMLPANCWVTSYLRVKEVQATDAIQ